MSLALRLRSVLFVPAANVRALQKSPELTPDALIFDLEDSAGTSERERALGDLIAVLETGRFAAPTRLVRINMDSLSETIAALTTYISSGILSGIVVPKVSGAGSLEAVAALCPPQTDLWAMIETPMGVVNLEPICRAKVSLRGLIVGPNDLRAGLRVGATPERREIEYVLAKVVLHARAHGMAVLDGVYNRYQDEDGLERESAQGKALGFDGKTLIHPAQIEVANRIFGPTGAQIEWAKAVVAGFEQPENHDKGVIAVGGEMVERMHLDTARLWLSLS